MDKIPTTFYIGKNRYSVAGVNGEYVKNSDPKKVIPPDEIRKLHEKHKDIIT